MTSKQYNKQTDAVQLAFAVAQMEAQPNSTLMLVDGLIKTEIQTLAMSDTRGVKGYFSQRCHDKGLNCRRIIFFDVSRTQTMSSKATGEGVLHFHGMFLLEGNQTEKWLRKKMIAVFGHADNARRHQLKIKHADPQQSYSFAGQKCSGVTGKLNYMLSHVGGTYNRIGLNESGKRSRKAPIGRGRINSKAKGLAQGIPSNFVSKAVIFDTKTKRSGKDAFDDWYINRNPSNVVRLNHSLTTSNPSVHKALMG